MSRKRSCSLGVLLHALIFQAAASAVFARAGNNVQIYMASSNSQALVKATAGIAALQGFYNQSIGLWDTTGWWNSANCLTVVANYAAVAPDFMTTATSIFDATFQVAQTAQITQARMLSEARVDILFGNGSTPRPGSIGGNLPGRDLSSLARIGSATDSHRSFLNDFYDDEGWWALGWIAAYDTLNQTKQAYLQTAQDIFEDMTLGWSNGTSNNATTCQGVFWNKDTPAINAIENELFISVAAHLANRVPSRKQYYVDWAVKVWSWFQGTGMINQGSLINDGLNITTCSTNQGPVFTYNQGVIIGGLVELGDATSSATDKASYFATAQKIAAAAIKRFADPTTGIFKESCDPYCGQDGEQFKGILMRNLYKLWASTGGSQILTSIQNNADGIWSKDRNATNFFGAGWGGPYLNATAGTQSSALDALVAAARAAVHG